MPWAAFESPWLWRPVCYRGHFAVAYEPGHVVLLVREAAVRAFAEGVARPATEEEIEYARRRRET
jgi:hypothetical protein